jgi:hypothetical protein
MFFWEDTSDELLRQDLTGQSKATTMTVSEVFEMNLPPPIGRVHAYAVTWSANEGFNSPYVALCGFELGGGLRSTAQRRHPFGPDRECAACRAIVQKERGRDAWVS